jgi:murein L,D-transpeptidase YcbB/YkuD
VLAEVDYGNHTPEPADILRQVADAGDAGAALESFNPPHAGFRALKAKLAELRAAAAADTDIAKGAKPDQQIERVIANMERWRWLPRDLGETYVMVNIPDYTLKVVHDHQTVWRTKIIAGKPRTPTPLLTASMQQIIINPSWHVPQSIIRKELLPRYARDPNIFARMGLVVKHSHGRIEAVQPPGARNALGRIKFDFPNEYSVYLHDTPEKRLFASDKRAFSHGCMRVENPTKFGEVIMAMALPAPAPNEQQIDRMFGRHERTFNLVNRPMVHLTYQTTFVDDAGKLALRDDVYGFDARIEAILHGGARHIAGVTTHQDIRHRAERRAAKNPSRLLGRPTLPQRPEPKRSVGGARAWPVAAAAPGLRAEAPPLPLLGPFLAIFSR